ncbi:MAG: tRNA pseudouridine(13) synthase TruD [Methanosarcinaceae archaeon]|nr:tRNA pseudouridine(13) synthase TruD [Methanosarcinaceae archaeon]
MQIPEIEKKTGIDIYTTTTEGIGGMLRQEIDDFIVTEITNREEGDSGKELILELTKRNWDMHHVIRDLSRKFGISQQRIGFAGTKDRRAVTTQKISINNMTPQAVDAIYLKDVELKVIGRSNRPVKLGDLTGNGFKIIVRDIELSEDELQRRLQKTTDEILETGGVPNFFGIQRFGAIRPITHLVGEAIVHGNIEEAALAYIARSFPDESEENRRVRDHVFKTRDYAWGLEQYPLNLRYERSMMHHLVTDPDDFVGAFGILAKSIRMMFVHAYQSYMFNQILCERVKEGLPLSAAVEGDIVCFKNKDGLPDISRTEKVTLQKLNGINNLIKRRRAFVTAPLIGYSTEWASGQQGEIEHRIFEKSGVPIEGFKVPAMPELASKGLRREMLLYAQPEYVASEDELNAGKTKTLLEFSLPKGSYATTLLREYMKVDPKRMS